MKEIRSKALYGDEFTPTDFAHRPRVSAKIRAYLIKLVQEHLLLPKKVIVTDKSDYRITFSLSPQLGHKEHDTISWTVRVRDGVKVIAIYIYNHSVTKEMTPNEYTNALFDGLKVFLTEQYKKITSEEVEAVRAEIDWGYIESLPFPAPFAEQDYILDANPNVEMAYHQQFGD